MKTILNKNKKGAYMSNMFYAIILILTIVIIVDVIILGSPNSNQGMNAIYGKNYSTGFTQNENDINTLSNTLQGQNSNINQGDAQNTGFGLTLGNSWTIIKSMWNIILSFITGNFINTLLVHILGFPYIIGLIAQIIFIGALIFIIIRLTMRVEA